MADNKTGLYDYSQLTQQSCPNCGDRGTYTLWVEREGTKERGILFRCESCQAFIPVKVRAMKRRPGEIPPLQELFGGE